MTYVKIRKGLSYVIGESPGNENHILPINAMQYSSVRNQLFSGGRDGVVKVWDGISNGHIKNGNNFNGTSSNGSSRYNQGTAVYGDGSFEKSDDFKDLDESLLRLETSISSNPLPYNHVDTNVGVTRNHNLHFDWINDIQLVNNDQGLVTCSSDLSLKLVNLDGDNTEKFSNVHTDYVKKLLYCDRTNSLISGGLDGRIVLWDLNRLSPLRIMNNNSGATVSDSIYSLANDGKNLVTCGGPASTINIYDKRLEIPFIKRLIGHQDTVRCLLMNDSYVLSGSSDSTIKLWDLRTFKVLKNVDVHDDPVWCLTSSSADFKTFYSADKMGNIVKTDLSYLYGSPESPLTGKLGLSTLVAKCDTPVMSLCVQDIQGEEISLFASTDMNLNRFQIPKTQDLALYQYLRTSKEIDLLLTDDLINDQNKEGDINSDFFELVSHLSMETNLDIQSNFLTQNNGNNAIEDFDSEYDSMFLNTSEGGPSMEFVNVDKNNNTPPEDFINNTPVEILLNPVRPEQISLIPFNKKPIKKYPLIPKSVIAKRLFNNKRWMLVLYLNGDISIWDIFICKKLKTFTYTSGAVEMTSEMIKKRFKDMDLIFQEHQTTDTLNNWCEVEIKSGKLLVTLGETNFNNVEVYYDELVEQYPFLDIETDFEAKKNSKVKITSDDRLQVSRILLNSIFHKYALFEWEFDRELREQLRATKKAESNSKDAFNKIKLLSRKSSSSIPLANSVSQTNSATNSSNVSINESQNPDDMIQEFIQNNDISEQEDSINYLLHDNKTRYSEKLMMSRLKVPETLLKIYSNNADLNRNYLSNEEYIPYKPLIDLNQFPEDLLIIIFENSPNLGNLRDVFSFRLSEIDDLTYTKESFQFVKQLRSYLPKWIGQPILYDKFPIKESPKIAFQLLEVDYQKLPPEKKIKGKSQRKIKNLPALESSIKLTSHNMLRVSKILNYLCEKFDSRTSEMKEKLDPVEWLVLECKGQELLPSMTLQTIKSKIWKSSSDIELRFRRKFD